MREQPTVNDHVPVSVVRVLADDRLKKIGIGMLIRSISEFGGDPPEPGSRLGATRRALTLKAAAAELGEHAGEGEALHPGAPEDKITH